MKRCLPELLACRARRMFVFSIYQTLKSEIFFPRGQDAEEEKKLILQQYEDLSRRKATINEEQTKLLKDLNRVKGQVQGFEDTRGQITVCLLFEMGVVFYISL